MRRSRSNAVLGLAIGSWLTVACTAGFGAPAGIEDPYDSPPNSRESPGPGRESPGAGFESPGPGRAPPPASTENPGNQGGGPTANGGAPAGGATTCPPCNNFKLTCLVVTGTKRDSDNVELETKNGLCVYDGDLVAGTVVVECNGKLSVGGQQVGTWQQNGTTFSGTATGGITFTCVPRTSTPTNPTTTVDASPPPVLDSGVKDTGVKDSASGG